MVFLSALEVSTQFNGVNVLTALTACVLYVGASGGGHVTAPVLCAHHHLVRALPQAVRGRVAIQTRWNEWHC